MPLSASWLRKGLLLLLLLLVGSQMTYAAEDAEEDEMDMNRADGEMDEDEDENVGMQEDDDEDVEYEDVNPYYHALTNMPAAAPDVSTGFVIVTHPPPADMAVGDNVEVICAFRNSGDTKYNVSFIAGSLNNPAFFGDYVSNFSEHFMNRIVESKTEASLAYKFTVPEFGVRVGAFKLALTVFYHDGEGDAARNFSTTFVNTTVNVVEGSGSVDTKTVIQFFVFAGITAYGVYTVYHPAQGGAGTASASAGAGAEEGGVDDHTHSISKHVRSGGARSGSGKKSR